MTAISPQGKTTTRIPAGIDARTERVLELRELVRRGLYQADARVIAAAMLSEWAGNRAGVVGGATPSMDFARFVVRPSEMGVTEGLSPTARSA